MNMLTRKRRFMLNAAICLMFLALFHLHDGYTANAENAGRIISLSPSLTEILFELGLDHKIVGVTTFCNQPPAAQKKRRVGSLTHPSLETIVLLKPDIVVMTDEITPKEIEEKLRSMGIKVYVFHAKRLHELPDGIRDLGDTLGISKRADILANRLESGMNRFRDRRQNREAKTIAFIIWPEPLILAGSGTVIDDAISLIGCKNIASGSMAPYPRYSIEDLIRQSPDLIFIDRGHAVGHGVISSFINKIAMLPAVRKGNVYYMDDSLDRLGLRVINGISKLAECVKGARSDRLYPRNAAFSAMKNK